MNKEKVKGILYIIAAAFGFSLMSVFVRLAGDLPPFQKAFFRNAVAFVFVGALMIKTKTGFRPLRGSLPGLFARSLFGTVGLVCNFYAIDRLVLADANMLNKLSPFFAILFSFLLLREKPRAAQLFGVLAAFIGSLFIIKPGISGMDAFPALIGFAGGVCAGAAYTFVRRLGLRGENSLRIIFCFSAFSCLFCLPFIIADHRPMSVRQTVFLILAGLAACLGQFGITRAYLFAPAKEISVYDYTQVIFAALFGFFVFGQTPDLLSVCGYVLICGAGVGMFLYNRKA